MNLAIDDEAEKAKNAQLRRVQDERAEDDDHYTMRISRRTVDKLGVKLYDRASAVVAELVANAYDADATLVRVRLPIGRLLGRDLGTGDEEDSGQEQLPFGEVPRTAADDEAGLGAEGETAVEDELIEVFDDGHGMNPGEADRNFLTVGQDRRTNPEQGATSRKFERKVMGRKGIGKLAPFGICSRIEVISAGGEETEDGFLTSHFVLDYGEIIQDTEMSYHPERGERDRTYSKSSGTTIRLSDFQRKRVPDKETFLRQLARRFGGHQTGFEIVVQDSQEAEDEPGTTVTSVSIPVVAKTRIDLGSRPVPTDSGKNLPVSGWIGMAQQGYKHEELAGVRIYARNKIVASTRDFGLMSGFTGENTLRSYLVGELHAEWLDEDGGEDLIKTDRQDILWESGRGQALRSWGQDLLREIGTLSRAPRRDNVRSQFLKIAKVEERARERYADESVVGSALDLAGMIGGFAAEDELTDEEYVDGLCEVILTVAPHRALMEAFREFKAQVEPEAPTLESLTALFDKTRVAELASYSQIAAERVAIIAELSDVVKAGAAEHELQNLIEKGPWLIDPSWSVITMNQSLRTFARGFEVAWKEKHGEGLQIAIIHETKRPDFTALEVAGRLRVVEIKAPNHVLDGEDFVRLQNYVLALREFFERNSATHKAFGNGWQIDLVVDGTALRDETQKEAFDSFLRKGEVEVVTWEDFITRAEQAHSKFMDARHASVLAARDARGEDPDADG